MPVGRLVMGVATEANCPRQSQDQSNQCECEKNPYGFHGNWFQFLARKRIINPAGLARIFLITQIAADLFFFLVPLCRGGSSLCLPLDFLWHGFSLRIVHEQGCRIDFVAVGSAVATIVFFSDTSAFPKLTSQAVADDLRCPHINQSQHKGIVMSNQAVIKILACAVLFAAAVRDVQRKQMSRRPMPQCKADLAVEALVVGRNQSRPPAFVPPQVVMARPSVAEVAKMNADLQQFIAASPDKGLFQKYEPDLGVQMPRENMAIRPVGGGVRGPRHQKFVTSPAPMNLTSCLKAIPSRIGGR